MADDLLARIDRTLDRIDSRLEQGDKRWEQERRAWERRDADWAKHQAEMRRFLDGLLERFVRVTQEQIGTLVGLQQEIGELRAESVDQRAQLRANTEATWRMLDRFPRLHPDG